MPKPDINRQIWFLLGEVLLLAKQKNRALTLAQPTQSLVALPGFTGIF
jgi:hypothetical protein